jgi:5-methylcytosine-specific restriction protein A
MKAIYPFQVGSKYSRQDVFDILGIPDPGGGNWYTGYTSYGEDWFVFCGVGTVGRTGHDYNNHFRNNELVWYGKTRSRLGQASIQKLTASTTNVYIFYREDNRGPFTFAGFGKAKQIKDVSPVEITWEFVSREQASEETLPEEISEMETVFEGAKKLVTINVYERDSDARRKCINYWGAACVVCNFDFKKMYGALGDGFIHVHHLKPLSEIGGQYELDPISDLRPVCPNCHAMIHRSRPPISIDGLKALIQLDKQKQN